MARAERTDPRSGPPDLTPDSTPHADPSPPTLPGLALTGPGPDRDADARRDPELLPRLLATPTTRVVTLRGGRLAVAGAPRDLTLALRSPVPADSGRLVVFLGRVDADGASGGEHAAYVGVVEPEGDADREAGFRGLRSVAVGLPPHEAALAATFSALANWHATHTHCSRCGTPTAPAQAGWVRRCPADGSDHFPRTDPAVIMAVVDADDRLLLARGAGFTATGMSVLAGFLEPGETLAAAVAREVAEEVGIRVTEVTYLGDQPWPFPTGLMVGFTARALDTELRLQDGEIEHAQWFDRESFAAALAAGELHISGRLSIARRLIEHWYGAVLDVPDAPVRRS